MIVSTIYALGDIFERMAQMDCDDLNIAYTVAMNLQAITTVKGTLDNKRRAIIDKHGEKDDQGNLVVNEDGSLKINMSLEFQQDWANFMNQDIEGFSLKSLKLSRLIQAGIKLTVQDIMTLGELIVDDMND